MTKLNSALLLALLASIFANVYQYLNGHEQVPVPQSEQSQIESRRSDALAHQQSKDTQQLNEQLSEQLNQDTQPHFSQTPNVHEPSIETDSRVTKKPTTPASAEMQRGVPNTTRFKPDRRVAYLAQTRRWLAAQEYAKLDAFFPLYLRQYPQDVEFLLLEAEYIAHTHLLSDAIIHYHGMLSLPLSHAQQTQVQNTISRLTNETINQLKQTYSWDILAQFAEPLLQVSPTSRELILALATAYAHQQQAGLMENTLASIRYEDPQAMQIRGIIQQYDDEVNAQSDRATKTTNDNPRKNVPAGVTSIGLQKYGDQYVVESRLSGNQVHFLIDTGASTTTISRQKFKTLFKSVATKFVGQFNVQTANGTVRSPMYQFASLEIAKAKVKNINVMVLPLDELGHSDGLLGMNFLREFDFRIDQKNALLHLQ
ncbi:peptidase A2A, retrovirus, catalytic [Paraglaciecola sp. T6c]|uniref:retropepsin-like aspartic protease family protein n=1 Tax=Pseudoalteromonas atlantica (strain T6c / ATCC BAA-1087) TaxID=3042615 RepID=UPI0000DA6E62|nr:retropepsin-like aspartic protease [Paraglaciecola sp. T6c]ABG41897.1 peptidase A2A, retrovirus, catalytic [Paraglaciecola sp. T6c]